MYVTGHFLVSKCQKDVDNLETGDCNPHRKKTVRFKLNFILHYLKCTRNIKLRGQTTLQLQQINFQLGLQFEKEQMTFKKIFVIILQQTPQKTHILDLKLRNGLYNGKKFNVFAKKIQTGIFTNSILSLQLQFSRQLCGCL